jgi:hypothetical protein
MAVVVGLCVCSTEIIFSISVRAVDLGPILGNGFSRNLGATTFKAYFKFKYLLVSTSI